MSSIAWHWRALATHQARAETHPYAKSAECCRNLASDVSCPGRCLGMWPAWKVAGRAGICGEYAARRGIMPAVLAGLRRDPGPV